MFPAIFHSIFLPFLWPSLTGYCSPAVLNEFVPLVSHLFIPVQLLDPPWEGSVTRPDTCDPQIPEQQRGRRLSCPQSCSQPSVSHQPSLCTLSLAPQVVRKIRAEQFSDASGNLKLWCQFFNILSDSKLTWYKDEIPVAEAQRR